MPTHRGNPHGQRAYYWQDNRAIVEEGLIDAFPYGYVNIADVYEFLFDLESEYSEYQDDDDDNDDYLDAKNEGPLHNPTQAISNLSIPTDEPRVINPSSNVWANVTYRRYRASSQQVVDNDETTAELSTLLAGPGRVGEEQFDGIQDMTPQEYQGFEILADAIVETTPDLHEPDSNSSVHTKMPLRNVPEMPPRPSTPFPGVWQLGNRAFIAPDAPQRQPQETSSPFTARSAMRDNVDPSYHSTDRIFVAGETTSQSESISSTTEGDYASTIHPRKRKSIASVESTGSPPAKRITTQGGGSDQGGSSSH